MTQEFIYNTDAMVTSTATASTPTLNLYELADEFNVILRTKLKNFDFGDPQIDPVEIASRLIDTVNYHKTYSIAANQCGLPHRVFVAGFGEEFVAFFNPEIISESIEEIIMQETDLSNMGLLLSVKRPKSVSVQYNDFNGEQKILQFDGLTARIVQQNIDRLNGIDFRDKVSKFVLIRAENNLKKRIKTFLKHNVKIKNKQR